MYAQAEKLKENKSKTVANSAVQKKNVGQQAFGVVDNRPEAIAQRKLQEMANNSPKANPVIQLKLKKEDALVLYQYYLDNYEYQIDFTTWQPYHRNIVLANDDIDEAIGDLARQMAELGFQPEEKITCTVGPFGTASGIAGEHVTFSDGMEWGIKRAPGVGFVYFEIRKGTDPGGTRYNDPYNKNGFNPGQMKKFLAEKGLGKHWEAFWKITKLKGKSG